MNQYQTVRTLNIDRKYLRRAVGKMQIPNRGAQTQQVGRIKPNQSGIHRKINHQDLRNRQLGLI
jgi:hypothetical protein